MDSKGQEMKVGGYSKSQGNISQHQQEHANGQTEAQSDGRIVHIYYESAKFNHMRVMDSDKTTVLYTADLRMKKPYMTIHSASSDTAISLVNFHTFSTRIDTTIHDQSIPLIASGMFKLKYSYHSPSFNGEMTWKPRSKLDELDMVLLNDKEMPVARFIPVDWSWKKGGKMELLQPCASNGNVMDEVMVTGLSVMYFRHIQRLVAVTATAANA